MSTQIPANLLTVDGFTQACLDAFDAELENQLGIDIEDYDEYRDVVRLVLKEQVDEGDNAAFAIERLSEDSRLIDVAESMELWEYIKLNPDFDQYIDFTGDTSRLADTLFDAFYSVVTRAPERAIREYFGNEYGIDPFDGETRILTA